MEPYETVPKVKKKKWAPPHPLTKAAYGGERAPPRPQSQGGPRDGRRTKGPKAAFGKIYLEDPRQAEAEGGGEPNYKAMCNQLQREFELFRRDAEEELYVRDREVSNLQKQCIGQKEEISKQRGTIETLLQALEEIKREGDADLNEAKKVIVQAERKNLAMERQVEAVANEQEKNITEATGRLQGLQAERNRLAEALAIISVVTIGGQAALNGESPNPQTIKKEAEAARAEGAEPLPRQPEAWLNFSYGSSTGRKPRGRTSRTMPYGGDGERALASLVSAVSRLHRTKSEAGQKLEATEREKKRLQKSMTRMTREYQAVTDMIETVEKETSKIKKERKLAGVIPSSEKSGLAARLSAVYNILNRLNLELASFQDDNARLKAKVLELDFYSKLHVKLIDTVRESGALQLQEERARRSAGL